MHVFIHICRKLAHCCNAMPQFNKQTENMSTQPVSNRENFEKQGIIKLHQKDDFI
jgi:hypothetical protein